MNDEVIEIDEDGKVSKPVRGPIRESGAPADYAEPLKRAWATCACADGDCDETVCHHETTIRKDYHCRCCSPTVTRECTNPLHTALLEMVDKYVGNHVSFYFESAREVERRRLRAAVGVDNG